MAILKLHVEKLQLISYPSKKNLKRENPDICLKRDMLKTAAQLKNSCPTIENMNSYYLSQKALYDTYDTQQEIYLK